MKIAVLLSSFEGTDYFLKSVETDRNPACYDETSDNSYEFVWLDKATCVSKLVELHQSGTYDLFLNLCEGSWCDEVPGEDVVRTLQRINAPFTGARLPFYSITKLAMKMAAISCGVDIPDHAFAYSQKEIESLRYRKWCYPLFVKHHNGHDSLGLTPQSKVNDFDSMAKRASEVLKSFGGVLVEEFIDGPEYTVLVVDDKEAGVPQAFEPVECRFFDCNGFKHFEEKWKNYIPPERVRDAQLVKKLKTAARDIFVACEASGYGRCDFRLDTKTGRLMFLEINANCSVFYHKDEGLGSADEILKLDDDRKGHAKFLKLIIKNALLEQRAAESVVKPAYTTEKGFFLEAKRDLAPGQVVLAEEDSNFRLVTRKFMARRWSQREHPLMWNLLNRYGYKISASTTRLWSTDQDKWCPINHSCDPNAWLDGLDLVARRPIKAGEEVTIDYATYSVTDGDESSNAFECYCDSSTCRGTVKPNEDFNLKSLQALYKGHFSDYVDSLIQKQSESMKSNGSNNNNH